MKKISTLNTDNIPDKILLVDKLKNAFREEMLATYQYVILKSFIPNTGNDKLDKLIEDVKSSFETNLKDELEDHAFWLANRIHELGSDCDGISDPSTIMLLSKGAYVPLMLDETLSDILSDIISSENRAIQTYVDLVHFSENRDKVTYKKMLSILKDEQEHASEMVEYKNKLSKLLSDIENGG